jgi:aspergillopepsin I
VSSQTPSAESNANISISWVFSSLLPAKDKTGHSIYTSSDSSTYKAKSGYTWDIAYADGSGASGVVGTDTVTVGKTTVKGQVIELAKKVSSTFITDAGDGLLGLAFSSINTGIVSYTCKIISRN